MERAVLGLIGVLFGAGCQHAAAPDPGVPRPAPVAIAPGPAAVAPRPAVAAPQPAAVAPVALSGSGGPSIELFVEPPPGGVTALRLEVRAPDGTVSWSCLYGGDSRCKRARGWFRGAGTYSLGLVYRFPGGGGPELRGEQRFSLGDDDGSELRGRLFFSASYGASVTVAQWVRSELVVVRTRPVVGPGTLAVVQDWIPDPKQAPRYRLRNIDDRPISILSQWTIQGFTDGGWVESKRVCWVCGNAVLGGVAGQRLPITLPPGEEADVWSPTGFGCSPPLPPGLYRSRLVYSVAPEPPPGPPVSVPPPPVVTSLEERLILSSEFLIP